MALSYHSMAGCASKKLNIWDKIKGAFGLWPFSAAGVVGHMRDVQGGFVPETEGSYSGSSRALTNPTRSCKMDVVFVFLRVKIHTGFKIRRRGSMPVAINAMLLFGMVLVSMFFYRYVSRISQLVAQIQKDVEELQGSDVAESCSFAQQSAFRLAVEIVDPVALAKRESQLASIAAELAPNFVAQEVYKRIQKEVAGALEKQGIDAKVTIFMA